MADQAKVTSIDALETFRFHEAANRIYDFFWGDFCDWYIELIKPRLSAENAPDPTTQRVALQNVVSLFEAALRLLHPIMPFITEEIWQAVYDGKPPAKSIALSSYPRSETDAADADAEKEMVTLQALIVDIRTARAEMKVEPRQKVPVEIFAQPEARRSLEQNRDIVQKLAGVESIQFVQRSLANESGARVASDYEVRVIFQQQVDPTVERERLSKDLKKMEAELSNARRQLANQQFLAKAPAPVVDGIRRRAAELTVLMEKAQGALSQLR